jgi:hypothetical protein
MMHFQDKYNEDLERLQRCDIHYLTPDLRIIPFCAFNVIPEWYRDRIQKKYSIPVEEWEKAHGQTLEAGLYRGLMRRGKSEAQMGCALSDMHKSAAEAAATESAAGNIDSDHRAVDLRNGMAGA